MLKKTIIPLLSFLSLTTIFSIYSEAAKAFDFTLNDGNNSANYDDDNSIGFNSWQVDNNNFLTETGLFYRVGNTGTAQPLNTMTEANSDVSGSSASINYVGTDFTLDLAFSLTDSGSTIAQTATVNNTSDSTLDFNLYSYLDFATSNGNTGDTVEIDGNNYTATQSGDLAKIITTVNQTATGNRIAEIEEIDFSQETLLDKLQLGASQFC